MAMDAMTEALRLTRAGRLSDATNLIRRALSRRSPAPSEQPQDDDIDLPPVIDLVPVARTVAPREAETPADRPAPEPPLPARFIECRHSGAAGTIDYRLYMPAGAAPGMPLLVMLHGCTQSPEDFARGTGMNRLADEFGIIVAYPRQTQAANPQKCWNWFRAGDQQRDRGEPALFAGVIRDLLREHHADPRRVYVAGLSAGGAAAANVAACYPDLIAAVGVHSGLAHGAARNLPAALAAMRNGSGKTVPAASAFVPTIAFHGDGDSTVHPLNSGRVVGAASAAFAGPLETRTESGLSASGRSFTRESSHDTSGRVMIEQWIVKGAGHAWSGGDPAGSCTDPSGPDASREMLRFFLGHSQS